MFIVRPGTGKVVGTASVVIMEGGVVVINVCVPSKDRVSVQVNVAIGGVELPVTVVKVSRSRIMLPSMHELLRS